MGTEESKKIWEENAQFWDNAMGDESNEFHREVVRPKVYVRGEPNGAQSLRMSVAMIPNEPHPNPDAAHSVGSASSCATSKFASQNKERKPVRN